MCVDYDNDLDCLLHNDMRNWKLLNFKEKINLKIECVDCHCQQFERDNHSGQN